MSANKIPASLQEAIALMHPGQSLILTCQDKEEAKRWQARIRSWIREQKACGVLALPFNTRVLDYQVIVSCLRPIEVTVMELTETGEQKILKTFTLED